MKAKFLLPVVVSFLLAGRLQALAAFESVVLEPSKDNTLYEPAKAGIYNSNGEGQHLFSGKVASLGNFKLRRALIKFDVANVVPAGSTVIYAALTLNLSQAPAGAAEIMISLHKLTSDWGEGTSNALSPEGQGAVAQANDATWRHNFFDSSTWDSEGGDFANPASASRGVDNPGVYTWICTSDDPMLADVQSWLDQPRDNYGWLIKHADETTPKTARRFDSKNHPDPDNRPKLTVAFIPPGTLLQDGFEASAFQCSP